jgi:AAA domain
MTDRPRCPACGRPMISTGKLDLCTGPGCGRPPGQCRCTRISGPNVIALAEVEPEHVDWLWSGYLPRGKLVILDGDPDQGKSAITLDLAARISTGSLMPDGTEPVKGAVLILSAEDGLADTIRPRLDAAGGDPEQVVTITEITAINEDGKQFSRPVVLPGDLPDIEQVITGQGVVLVIVDVLMAYLSGTVNAHRDQDIRRALHPLAAMAGRTGCYVLVIRHLNKTAGTHAIYRGGGSIGIVGAARAAFMVGADPEDDSGRTRVLASVKCNLARRPPSLAYRLDADELHGCVRVNWQGISDRRAADLLADRGTEDERTERDEAVEWLKGYLTDSQRGGEGKAGEIIKAAEKDGIGRYALHRARRRAGVTTAKSSSRGGWLWRLNPSEGCTKVVKVTEPRTVQPTQPTATFGDQGEQWPPGSIGAQASQEPPEGERE